MRQPTGRRRSGAPKLYRWTTIIANLCQVGLLAVIAIGYFTSVRPLAQKEFLAEQVASLEIEKQRIQTGIAKTRSERNLLALQARDLAVSLEQNKAQLSDYLNSLELARSELDEKKIELQAVQKTLATLTQDIAYAERSFQDYIEASLLGETEVSFEIAAILRAHRSDSPFRDPPPDNLSSVLERQWLDPEALVKGRTHQIERLVNDQKNPRMRKAWSTVLNKFIERTSKWADVLDCRTPEFQVWEEAFIEASDLIEPAVVKCVETLWKKLEKERGWRDVEIDALKRNEFWTEQSDIFAHTCRVSVDSLVADMFSDKWNTVNDQCYEIVRSISRVGLRDEPSFIDHNDWDLRPPSRRLIRSELNSVGEKLEFLGK